MMQADDAYLVAGGWEPLMYCRRDIGERDLEEGLVRQHSDASLRRMAEDGIRLFITHYHKGFGWDVIQDEIRDVKRQVASLHKNGMYAGVYVRVDNVIGETFFLEMPEARSWLVKTQDGASPTIMGRYFRHRVCRNVPAYREYLTKVLEYAVREIGVDMFSLDGFHGAAEREECRCAHCRERFRAFLKARWGGRGSEARRRFGFPRVDGIEIPAVGPGNRSEATANVITDPVYQEYIRFRCEDWAEWHRFVMSVIRKANPHVLASLNCGVFSWTNTTAQSGVYLPLLDSVNTMIFIEDGHFPAVREGGVLCHRIRDYKIAASLGLRCIPYCHQYSVPYVKRAMSESMAFNGGMVGHVTTEEDVNASAPAGEAEQVAVRQVAAWRKANGKLWKGVVSASEVGVLRSYHSMAYDCYATWRHTMLLEETLIRRHIPFDIVFDEQLESLLGTRIKVLVLGNQSCLSDPVLERIARFAATGGRILATGDTGGRTANALLRKQNALLRVLGLQGATGQAPARRPASRKAKFETVFADHGAAGRRMGWPGEFHLYEHVCGKGMLAYLPDVTPAVDREVWHPQWQFDAEAGCYRIPGEVADPTQSAKEYPFVNWRLPVNAGQIVDALRVLYDAPFLIDAPDTTAVNWLRGKERNHDLLHFVNYGNEHAVLGASLSLLGNGYRAAQFHWMDPQPGRRSLNRMLADGHLRLPPFQTYGVLKLECK